MTPILERLLTPVRGFRKQYLPLLLIYFAYGAQGFTTVALTFWEKDNLTLSTEQLIMIATWVTLPWSMKVLFGPLIDSVKIFGSARKIYILIGAALVAIQFLLLATMSDGHSMFTSIGMGSYQLYLFASILGALGFVIQDVTADTMTTEVVDRKGKTEAQIKAELTMVQLLGRLSLYSALLIGAAISGIVADKYEFADVMLMALAIPLLSVVGVIFLSLQEVKEQPNINTSILVAALFYIAFSSWMAFGDIQYGQEISFCISLIVLTYLIKQLLRTQAREVVLTFASLIFVVFVFRAMPSTGPGFSWFGIDQLGFDERFLGTLRTLSAVIGLVTLWLISSWIIKQSIKQIYILLIFVTAFVSLPEILLYYGWHESLGLSARTVALIDTAAEGPLANIALVPLLALIAYYAPAGSRATWFAVATSMINLALTASSMLTRYLNQIYVVSREIKNPAGDIITQADYSQLGQLMIVKTIIEFVVPLLAVLLLWHKDFKKNQTQE